MKKATPILTVEAIEPCLEFWVDRLGFEKTTEVPHEDRLAFAILVRGGIEIMLQTTASLEADIPGVAPPPGGSMLFVEVDDLDATIDALGDAPVVVPRRTTFYGADEIFVREPGGNVVGFARFGAAG
ncbi:MAG TPA: VOC family protein [Gemmatimonadota bacterium]|nr:VOC family protein [Gemmatimonadota bacterium]